MLFNGASFAVFYVLFFVVFHFGARSRGARLWILVLGSLVFYSSFSLGGLVPLLASGAVTHALGRRLARATDGKRRLLVLAVGLNVALWTVYRIGNWADGAIVFPLGLSFYILQNISFLFDVHRGSFKPDQSLLEFLASLTYFPHLLSGPIVRSSFLMPQLARLAPPDAATVRRAYLLIAVGLTKKTLADLMAPLAANVFGAAAPYDALASWTAALAFAAQIYGDFSGYTDIAMGISALLGIELPQNFDRPYLSASPIEFWRRWHMTLSSWFRDYLYFSLALGPLKRHAYLNVVITMLIAGLWHGGGWNYLLFGLYHGLLMAATQALALRFPRAARRRSSATRVWRTALTFYLVLLGMIIFRSSGLAQLWQVLRGLHAPVIAATFDAHALARLGFAVAALGLGQLLDAALLARRALAPAAAWAAATSGFAFAFLFGGASQPFIYFRF